MLKACSRCGKIHKSGECKAADNATQRNSRNDKFRSSKAWKVTADDIKRRDYSCCRVCAEEGKINCRQLSVHHIIPLQVDFDRRFDEANLITLCRYHHEQAEKGVIPAKKLIALAASEFDITRLIPGS